MLPAGADSKRTSPWVKYEKGQLLGSGQHSHTYQATDKATGEQVGACLCCTWARGGCSLLQLGIGSLALSFVCYLPGHALPVSAGLACGDE